MAENAGGILGSFLQGYSQGKAQREAQKQQKIGNLMQLADHYSKWADDPNAEPEIQAHAADQMKNVVMQAEKIQNEKAGGLTALMKLKDKIFGKNMPGAQQDGFPGAMQNPPTILPSFSNAAALVFDLCRDAAFALDGDTHRCLTDWGYGTFSEKGLTITRGSM